MTSRRRRLVPVVVCAALTALACSLPGRLLQSAASEAVDVLQETLMPESGSGGQSGSQGEQPEAGAGLPGSGETSVAYDIYVGANVTGTCGAFTNSGGFQALTFDSVIRGIRFAPPSEQAPPGPYGGILREGGMPVALPGIGLEGEGELGNFAFCPMYEPESHPCSVTEGPSPFQPSLSVAPSESDIPAEPLVGTPVPSGGGAAVLIYSIGGTSELGPIMTWDCEIGTGALGGAVNPVQVMFSTSWDRLMQGEAFDLEVIQQDEGGTWEWTIRFMPAE